MHIKSKWSTRLNWLGWLTAVGFLVIAGWRLLTTTDWALFIEAIDFSQLAIATLLLFVGLFVRSMSGYVVFSALDKPITITESWRIWFLSQLSKYIPGGIWQFASRSVMYTQHGLSVAFAGIVTVWEIISILLIGILIFLSLGLEQTQNILIAWGIGIVLLVLILGLTLNKGIWEYLAHLRIPFTSNIQSILIGDDKQRYQSLIALCVLSLIGWIFVNLSFHYLTQAFLPDTVVTIRQSFLVYSLAWVSGFLVIFAPGGLGAREAVIIAMYTTLYGESTAISLALFSRLIWFIAEGIHIMLASITTYKSKSSL